MNQSRILNRIGTFVCNYIQKVKTRLSKLFGNNEIIGTGFCEDIRYRISIRADDSRSETEAMKSLNSGSVGRSPRERKRTGAVDHLAVLEGTWMFVKCCRAGTASESRFESRISRAGPFLCAVIELHWLNSERGNFIP